MSKILNFTLLCCVFTLATCYSGPIDGTYYSAECEPSGLPIKGSSKQFMTFNLAQWTMRYEYYSDHTCSNLTFVMFYDGFVTYQGIPVNVGIAVNLGIHEPILMPASASAASFLNTQCGTSIFAVGTSTDLENVTCPAINVAPTAECGAWQTIAAIENGYLYLGNLSCSNSERPTTLNTERPFTPISLPFWEGVWTKECQDVTVGAGPPFSYTQTLDLAFKEYKIAYTVFTAAGCNPDDELFTGFQSGIFGFQGISDIGSSTFDTILAAQHTHMYIFNATMASNLQHLFNGVTCPYMKIEPFKMLDFTDMSCVLAGFATAADCPFQFDVLAIRTNYITPYLYVGNLDDYNRMKLCSPANRPTTLEDVKMYNTSPNPVQSLVSLPIAVAVIVTFVVGAIVFGLVCGGLCRRLAFKKARDEALIRASERQDL